MHLGISGINSLEQETTPARVMAENIGWSIRAALTAFGWTFSESTKILTPSLEITSTDALYENVFELPSNFQYLNTLLDGSARRVLDYKIEGTLVYANVTKLTVRYTAAPANVLNIPHYLAELIAYHLAGSTAIRLTESENRATENMRMYETYLAKAKVTDSRQSSPKTYFPDTSSSFLEAHNNYGSV